MAKAVTPDERFLMAAYKKAVQEEGDVVMDFWNVGKSVGLRETATKNIVKHLAQANFILKVDDNLFRLTAHGRSFVEKHLM